MRWPHWALLLMMFLFLLPLLLLLQLLVPAWGSLLIQVLLVLVLPLLAMAALAMAPGNSWEGWPRRLAWLAEVAYLREGPSGTNPRWIPAAV